MALSMQYSYVKSAPNLKKKIVILFPKVNLNFSLFSLAHGEYLCFVYLLVLELNNAFNMPRKYLA